MRKTQIVSKVRDRLCHDPLSGHLFLFANRERTRLKVLVWDGSGLWVGSLLHWSKIAR